MRILAVADLHGKQDRLDRIAGAVREAQADVVVIAGDITGRRRVNEVISMITGLSLPVLMVSGNSDSSVLFREIPRHRLLVDLHLNRTILANHPFMGLSGTIPLPFYSKIRFREDRLFRQLAGIVSPETILVTHTPPRGSMDRVLGKLHAGSKSLAAYIDRAQPRLLICGHIHEDAGFCYRGKTCVVNCSVGGRGNGFLIELAPGNSEITPMAL